MTIKDIARLSGYGIGTVSRVINDQPGVSDKTRKKILKVIRESNYEPNENARQLKMKSASTVSIIMKGRATAIVEKCMELLSSLEEDTIIHTIDEREDEVEEALRLIRNQNLKGILFLGADLGLFDERIDELDVPCVIATSSASALHRKNISSVCIDDEKATIEMIQYLCGKGHENIVVIGGTLSEENISYARFKGCKSGFVSCGLEFDPSRNYISCRYSAEAGYAAAKQLLKENKEVTAVFALSDMIALGVIRAINDMGKRVPDDISVAGFDGILFSDFTTPRITTIRQDAELIARRSVELLMKLPDHAFEGEHIIIPHQLVEKESVRKL